MFRYHFFGPFSAELKEMYYYPPLQKTEILPICFCVFHTKMIKNIIFNSTKTLVYVSSFICGLYVYASFHCIGSSGFKIIWRAYLGECPGIEDGRHFRGNEPQGKRVFCFFILIIIHLQWNEWVVSRPALPYHLISASSTLFPSFISKCSSLFWSKSIPPSSVPRSHSHT